MSVYFAKNMNVSTNSPLILNVTTKLDCLLLLDSSPMACQSISHDS